MTAQLKNILRFVAIPASGSEALPHGLHDNGKKLIPDACTPSTMGVSTITADDTIVTVTNNGPDPLNIDVLCESWHTIEREFGAAQITALSPQPFVPGEGIPSTTVLAVPARTLFVSKAWPAGADPLLYFTTIAAALVQSATLNPSAVSPITIIVYPGTYAEPLTLVSNVNIFSTARRATVVTGAITWTPGAGVNAPQAALREEVCLVLPMILAPISVDATAKTGDISTLDCRDAGLRAGVTFVGRLGLSDFFQVWDTVFSGGAASFTDANVNIFASTVDAITFAGTCAIDMRADELFGAVNISGASAGAIQASQISGVVNIGAGCSVNFTGSRLQGVLTVAAGGAADVRMAEYSSNANLAGAGTIERSIWRTTFGPTAAGANAVPIAPPLANGSYNVCLTQTAGVAGNPPLVTAKTGAGFTLTDAAGGNTFDVTILKE